MSRVVFVGHLVLALAHAANAIGALASLWGRPVFAVTALLLAGVQVGASALFTAGSGSESPGPDDGHERRRAHQQEQEHH